MKVHSKAWWSYNLSFVCWYRIKLITDCEMESFGRTVSTIDLRVAKWSNKRRNRRKLKSRTVILVTTMMMLSNNISYAMGAFCQTKEKLNCLLLKNKRFMALLNCNAEVAFNDSRAFFVVVVVVLLFFVFFSYSVFTSSMHTWIAHECHLTVLGHVLVIYHYFQTKP